MAKAERIAGYIIFLFGVAYLLGGRNLKLMEEFGPGPGFFPMLLGLALLALCLAFIFQARADGDRPNPFKDVSIFLRPLGLLALLALVNFLLVPLGFILTISLFIFILLVFFERHKILPSLFYALSFSLFFYLIFAIWLKVQLPLGLIGF